MNSHRKQARDFLRRIKTVAEFNNYLDSLTLTDEEKEIVKEIYIKGYSHTQIAQKHNMSIEKSKKIIQRTLDKVL